MRHALRGLAVVTVAWLAILVFVLGVGAGLGWLINLATR